MFLRTSVLRNALLAALLAVPLAHAESAGAVAKGDTNPEEAMPAPKAITVNADELGRLLEGAGWVHKGQGRVPLYAVGFRSCPDCVALEAGAYDKLEAAGADIRDIVYARADSEEGKPRSKPGERAMVAEIWKNRNYNLWVAWHETDPDTYYATEDLPPSADTDPDRMALVQKSRDTVAKIEQILNTNGLQLYVPALFWRENGVWQVYVGYNPQTFDALVPPHIAGS